MGFLGGIVKTMLPLVPRALVGRIAQRYVAGSDLAAGMSTARALNAEGATTTMDILGEFVTEPAATHAFLEQYLELVDAVHADGLDSSVSVKLTMLGLSIDPALCREHMERLCARASQLGVYITIDMEDSPLTDAILATYREMRARHGRVGCVLQAYLKRTAADAAALEPGANVRLCKGIYVEPESIAFKGYQEVRDNYVRVLEQLLAAGHYACIATHDEWLVARAEELIAARGLARDTYEFQMLLGVKPALRRRLLAAGHTVRIYVPYGADWYAYSIRRLRENPQVGVHVLKAMLGLG